MEIGEKLKDFNKKEVDVFMAYVNTLKTDKKSGNTLKNPWAVGKPYEWYINLFKKNALTGLKIDGIHITIQNTGLSYDYMAYKQKMIMSYPESKLDFSEIYDGDDFSFEKNNGVVSYKHKFKNPFDKNIDKIIGLYCIIKNKRGEFLTLLNKEEIQKHRTVAKTDFIWKAWPLEMMYKTIIKKATRIHFEDVFKEMNEEDNKSIDLSQPVDIDLEIKQTLEEIKDLPALEKYYKENSGKQQGNLKAFNKVVAIRKGELASNDNS